MGSLWTGTPARSSAWWFVSILVAECLAPVWPKCWPSLKPTPFLIRGDSPCGWRTERPRLQVKGQDLHHRHRSVGHRREPGGPRWQRCKSHSKRGREKKSTTYEAFAQGIFFFFFCIFQSRLTCDCMKNVACSPRLPEPVNYSWHFIKCNAEQANPICCKHPFKLNRAAGETTWDVLGECWLSENSGINVGF